MTITEFIEADTKCLQLFESIKTKYSEPEMARLGGEDFSDWTRTNLVGKAFPSWFDRLMATETINRMTKDEWLGEWKKMIQEFQEGQLALKLDAFFCDKASGGEG